MNDLAVERHAQERLGSKGSKRRAAARVGHLKLRPSSPPVKSRQLRGQRLEGRGHGQRDHRVEDRLHAQAEQADQQRQQPATAASAAPARRPPRQARAQARAGDRDAVGADAEEHGVREADDAGVAQQQVEAGHQHDEDQHLRRHVQRLAAREQEGREGQRRARSAPAPAPASGCAAGRAESRRFSMRSSVRHRVQALRPPQQHRHHQPDVGEQRHLRRQEAGVVGHQPDQQRADEAAAASSPGRR